MVFPEAKVEAKLVRLLKMRCRDWSRLVKTLPLLINNSTSISKQLTLALSVTFSATFTLHAEPIYYNRDVRPILSENCFFCHGFDKETREADLRLDTFEGATSGGAVVPGKPESSSLISRIYTKDKNDLMPPHDSAYRLDDKEKEILTNWIKQGANYEEHWAYKPLKQPTVPTLAKHPVDAFLTRTWQREGVSPVKKAKPRTILRRLSFDLRGLPPSTEEVAAFEENPSDEHLQSFIDQWITSLEHAEHQALLWLDLVRWADSAGLVSDEPIASGAYRKYVVEAFQQNTPFDTFTREQLAGDLLENPTNRSLIASAYNRLVKTNCEAGVIEKEALYALKGEHVRALGTVWLGTTTGCAECHDHKYDPITAKDYYSMAAFFDDLIEAGVYEPGDRRVPLHYIHDDEETSKNEHSLAQQIDAIRAKLYGSDIDLDDQAKWSAEILKQDKAASEDKKTKDWIWFPAKLAAAHVMLGEWLDTPKGRLVEAQEDELKRHFSGETLKARPYGDNKGYFAQVYIDPNKAPSILAVQVINGAYRRIGWHKNYHVTYYWGEKDHPTLQKNFDWLDPTKLVYLGPIPTASSKNETFVQLEIPKEKFAKAPYHANGMAWLQIGGSVTWGNSGYRTTARRVLYNEWAESAFRYFWELPYNRDDRDDFQNLLTRSIWTKPEKRREIHNIILNTTFQEHQNPELVQKLNNLYQKAYLSRQNATASLVSKAAEPKKTYVLKRGNFMNESVPLALPAIPEVFSNKETISTRRLNRLDLANWLTSPENPLTARVFVNRLWHQFYGRGLSETLEDIGNQGDWPSHVHLLDWLAAEFSKDWDIRRMIRMLITSKAYQLSSIPSDILAKRDPTNRLHARQSRMRHSAEEIRDTALFAAGLLKNTHNIPVTSFFPYQPDSYWAKSNKIMYGSRLQIWDTNKDNSQYQRSLYTYWKRQNIHPGMLAFDAPTRQECSARRTISNTPAQALALLNDPQYVEAARALATRVMKFPTEQRIDKLFEFTLQRMATNEERNELFQFHEKIHEHFESNIEEAESLLSIGNLPNNTPSNAEQAAWTATARVLLNLHEFITRS